MTKKNDDALIEGIMTSVVAHAQRSDKVLKSFAIKWGKNRHGILEVMGYSAAYKFKPTTKVKKFTT